MNITEIRKHSIVYYSYILLFIVLFFYGLYNGKSFLIPVSLATLFAMLLWPVSKYLEEKGVSRAWAAGICVFILLLFLIAFVFFFVSQVSDFSSQMGNLKSQLNSMLEQFRNFLQSKFGLNTQNFFSGAESGTATGGGSGSGAAADTVSGQGNGTGTNSAIKSGAGTHTKGSGGSAGTSGITGTGGGSGTNGSGGSGFGFGISSYLSTLMSSLKTLATVTFKTLVGLVVISVYVFLMLLYRHIFINFVKKIAPKKQEAERVTREVANVSKQYLAGRLIVIGIVAVINSVGLTLIGIKQGIFFGVLAALLDLIPYIGVLIGAGLPLIMSLVNHEKMWPFFAVLGLFVFVQLLENYYLTPRIVGSKVRLSPLFTLMAVLVGGYVWGVAGMILFIPFLAMLKIIFDHIEPLHPYGYLVGDPDNRTEKK